MSSWKIIFATLIIFATGLVVGGLLVDKTGVATPSITRSGNQPTERGGPFRPQSSLQLLLYRMDHELALTPEQHDQIQTIIQASQKRADELWKPVAQAVNKETQDACDQIRVVLTPEQRAKFDALPRGGRGPEFGERGGWRRGPIGPPGSFPSNRFPTNFRFDRDSSAPTKQP